MLQLQFNAFPSTVKSRLSTRLIEFWTKHENNATLKARFKYVAPVWNCWTTWIESINDPSFKVYMTDFFFIWSIKSPQCADKCSKKTFSIAIFLPRVMMCQKRQISLPVGYKTARPKTGDWERLWRQFRTPSLAKNRFLSHFLIVS